MTDDIFAYRDVRRLAVWLNCQLIQARGKFILIDENEAIIREFDDLETVRNWLESMRFSPC